MALDLAKVVALFGAFANILPEATLEAQNLQDAAEGDQFVKDLIALAKTAGAVIDDADLPGIQAEVALALNLIGVVVQKKENPAVMGANITALIKALFPPA